MKPISRSKWTKAYRNPYGDSLKKRLFNLFLYGVGYQKESQLYGEVPSDFVYPYPTEPHEIEKPSVMWINHSTFFVSINGVHFLTDPIFSERCSLVSFAGPKRKHAPGIELDQLPRLDFILISHDHYDHLDKPSVLRLHQKNPQAVWCVPYRVRKWFKKLGILKVIEFEWWQKHTFSESQIRITAVPAQHFSGRWPFAFNRTLWLGFVVEFLKLGKKVYFAGDTGYNPIHFKEIKTSFQSLDLSLLPIGAYQPKRFMQSVHVCPKEAVLIHQDVCSQLSVAGHHGTFSLALEKLNQPPFDLFCALQEAQLDNKSFCVLKPGQVINW